MFNESNTVEAYVRDLLAGPFKPAKPGSLKEDIAPYGLGKGIGWTHVAPPEVPRQIQEVLVEPWLRAALIRLNPEIAEQPDRADEVLYKLRAIVLSVRSDGLIRANEEMTAWLRGERSMPFGPNNEHVPIRLIDFVTPEQNQYVVTQQFVYRAGATERRADLVLLVNGLPLVLIEAKTPTRKAVSWVDGALQVHDDYEKFVPELFVCNVFSVATEGKEYHYGSIGLPVKDWGPWHLDGEGSDALQHPLKSLQRAAESMLRPHVVLDILASFTLFATDKKQRRIKIICRYQQYEAANRIVERVLAGYPKKGLIWHFQGSGKSLLMVFAAQKLRMHPLLKNPTVLIVVDRIDLDSQITGTFAAADIPNLEKADCRVNRTYSEQKTHGLIVDYLGIFDDVAAALEFDDQSVKQVVSNIQELKDKLPEVMQKCLAFFPGVDRTQEGYEGLISAQQCLPNNEVRDNFAAEYSLLNKIWEALSPDPLLGAYAVDYKWLSQVYQSVQPSSGYGKLIWHSLGAKTIELIHQNVHVDAVRDDLDTLILDADLLEAVLSNPEPKKAKEIEIKVARRLRKHLGNPKFKKLSERLDALRDRFESGVLNSVEFLKQLLEIAKEVLQAEKEVPPEEDEDRGKAALTELFNEVKTAETPIIVERVVADIDEIVRLVRFPGWQDTLAGEREVKKALRKALFKYRLHQEEELFEKAYSYIRQYY